MGPTNLSQKFSHFPIYEKGSGKPFIDIECHTDEISSIESEIDSHIKIYRGQIIPRDRLTIKEYNYLIDCFPKDVKILFLFNHIVLKEVYDESVIIKSFNEIILYGTRNKQYSYLNNFMQKFVASWCGIRERV